MPDLSWREFAGMNGNGKVRESFATFRESAVISGERPMVEFHRNRTGFMEL